MNPIASTPPSFLSTHSTSPCSSALTPPVLTHTHSYSGSVHYLFSSLLLKLGLLHSEIWHRHTDIKQHPFWLCLHMHLQLFISVTKQNEHMFKATNSRKSKVDHFVVILGELKRTGRAQQAQIHSVYIPARRLLPDLQQRSAKQTPTGPYDLPHLCLTSKTQTTAVKTTTDTVIPLTYLCSHFRRTSSTILHLITFLEMLSYCK